MQRSWNRERSWRMKHFLKGSKMRQSLAFCGSQMEASRVGSCCVKVRALQMKVSREAGSRYWREGGTDVW